MLRSVGVAKVWSAALVENNKLKYGEKVLIKSFDKCQNKFEAQQYVSKSC